MSKIINCKTCGIEIAKSAKSCPSCGAKNSKPLYKRWWFVTIVIIFLLGAIGSSGNNIQTQTDSSQTTSIDTATTNANTPAKKEEPKVETKITYENFLNIKMGKSYGDIVALIGEGKEFSSSEIAGIKTIIYEWHGNGLNNINVTVQNNEVVGKAQLGLKDGDSKITMELYNKIQNGMTYEQVKSILGDGQILSEVKIMDSISRMYSYANKDGSNANFTFTNDSMDMKAQFNLK